MSLGRGRSSRDLYTPVIVPNTCGTIGVRRGRGGRGGSEEAGDQRGGQRHERAGRGSGIQRGGSRGRQRRRGCRPALPPARARCEHTLSLGPGRPRRRGHTERKPAVEQPRVGALSAEAETSKQRRDRTGLEDTIRRSIHPLIPHEPNRSRGFSATAAIAAAIATAIAAAVAATNPLLCRACMRDIRY